MAIRFKAGMKVQINSELTGLKNSSNPHVSSYGHSKGDTVTLLKYDSKDETWQVSNGANYFNSFWIKRANLKPLDSISAFKIGDRVTILKEQCSPIQVPATGTVIRVGNPKTGEGYGVTIDEEFLTKSHGAIWAYDAVNMRAVKQEYKVGDKVVIVKNTTNGHEVGTECTIAEMPTQILSYRLVNSTGTTMRHPASNFTLIKTTKTEVMNKTVHQQMLEFLDLKPGDKVKVLRKAESRELGWENRWISKMTPCIGKTLTVRRVNGDFGVSFSDGPSVALDFPAHVLELIERKPISASVRLSVDYTATITKESVVVGCQTIKPSTLRELVTKARELGMDIK